MSTRDLVEKQQKVNRGWPISQLVVRLGKQATGAAFVAKRRQCILPGLASCGMKNSNAIMRRRRQR
eukprot:3637225-Pleurochrysis_carterae.AAC.3